MQGIGRSRGKHHIELILLSIWAEHASFQLYVSVGTTPVHRDPEYHPKSRLAGRILRCFPKSAVVRAGDLIYSFIST